MELQNETMKLNDEKWLDKIPIAPFSINRSRFSDMINIMYFYTHNVTRSFVTPNDIWKVFRDQGYIAYDREREVKYFLSPKGEDMLELKKGTVLLIKEDGQSFFIEFLKNNILDKQKKKKRKSN